MNSMTVETWAKICQDFTENSETGAASIQQFIEDKNFYKFSYDLLTKELEEHQLVILLQAIQAKIQKGWDPNDAASKTFKNNFFNFCINNLNQTTDILSLTSDILGNIALIEWPNTWNDFISKLRDFEISPDEVHRIRFAMYELKTLSIALYNRSHDENYRNFITIQQIAEINANSKIYEDYLIFILRQQLNEDTFEIFVETFDFISKICKITDIPIDIDSLTDYLSQNYQYLLGPLTRCLLSLLIYNTNPSSKDIELFHSICQYLPDNNSEPQDLLQDRNFYEIYTNLIPLFFSRITDFQTSFYDFKATLTFVIQKMSTLFSFVSQAFLEDNSLQEIYLVFLKFFDRLIMNVIIKLGNTEKPTIYEIIHDLIPSLIDSVSHGVSSPFSIDEEKNISFASDDKNSLFCQHENIISNLFRLADELVVDFVRHLYVEITEGEKSPEENIKTLISLISICSILGKNDKANLLKSVNQIIDNTMDLFLSLLDSEDPQICALSGFYFSQIFDRLRDAHYRHLLRGIIFKFFEWFNREDEILNAVAAECLNKICYFLPYVKSISTTYPIFANTIKIEEKPDEPIPPILPDLPEKFFEIWDKNLQNCHFSLVKFACSIYLMMTSQVSSNRSYGVEMDTPEYYEEIKQTKENLFGRIYSNIQTNIIDSFNQLNYENPETMQSFIHACDIFLCYEVLVNPKSEVEDIREDDSKMIQILKQTFEKYDDRFPIDTLNPLVKYLFEFIIPSISTLFQTFSSYLQQEQKDENMVSLFKKMIEKSIRVLDLILKTFEPRTTMEHLGNDFLPNIFNIFAEVNPQCFVPFVFTFLRNIVYYAKYTNQEIWNVNENSESMYFNIINFAITQNVDISCRPEIIYFLRFVVNYNNHIGEIINIHPELFKNMVEYAFHFMESEDVQTSIAAHKLLFMILLSICNYGANDREKVFREAMDPEDENSIYFVHHWFLEIMRISITGQARFIYDYYYKIISIGNFQAELKNYQDFFVRVLTEKHIIPDFEVPELVDRLLSSSITQSTVADFIVRFSGLNRHDPEFDKNNIQLMSSLKVSADFVQEKKIPKYTNENTEQQAEPEQDQQQNNEANDDSQFPFFLE
ncbi:hypothetical protein TVAG_162820 [Trichomonas vaginalis G3]|uniref:Importin N-terminal domain-containing protein n=1 Tax=Trichomonas vaginalis (strain ATCC PRA-98 / G3) TaxID=412133 RepID=A2DFW0_TRIV3|nr:armadillo (ARM) repeat-containing protein family [Trichomonas vaginalis G3]EAY20587.1 hypothetical protein TVAG_162820 [Trichomonas vaginalis G3]KAI5487228.1 armadillo (ARM) repeat-containing protein family [Trichomonas vaginalis G3]|eukprot:XP_001581573.1 hypothetical protein [Trichomonas vaginalis G3]